jgi:hypothetical protein
MSADNEEIVIPIVKFILAPPIRLLLIQWLTCCVV